MDWFLKMTNPRFWHGEVLHVSSIFYLKICIITKTAPISTRLKNMRNTATFVWPKLSQTVSLLPTTYTKLRHNSMVFRVIMAWPIVEANQVFTVIEDGASPTSAGSLAWWNYDERPGSVGTCSSLSGRFRVWFPEWDTLEFYDILIGTGLVCCTFGDDPY